MADRLSVDRQYVENLIKTDIDKVDVLNFKSKGERTDIFLFAFALGVNAGKRLKSKVKEGLVLESAVKGKDFAMSFIYSVVIDELRKTGKENLISDKDMAYGIAEEYANAGFELIKEMIPDFSKYNEEEFVYSLIEMMDDKIEEIEIQE